MEKGDTIGEVRQGIFSADSLVEKILRRDTWRSEGGQIRLVRKSNKTKREGITRERTSTPYTPFPEPLRGKKKSTWRNERKLYEEGTIPDAHSARVPKNLSKNPVNLQENEPALGHFEMFGKVGHLLRKKMKELQIFDLLRECSKSVGIKVGALGRES